VLATHEKVSDAWRVEVQSEDSAAYAAVVESSNLGLMVEVDLPKEELKQCGDVVGAFIALKARAGRSHTHCARFPIA
jgi:hypothetical protein